MSNKYKVEEISGNEIVISGGNDRVPVHIEFSSEAVSVQPDHGYTTWVIEYPYSDWSGILNQTGNILFFNWIPPKKTSKQGWRYESNLKQWAVNKIGSRLNKLIYPYFLRKRKVSPWYPYQKSFFSSTGYHMYPNIHNCDQLWENKYFLDDLLKYPAACHYLHYLGENFTHIEEADYTNRIERWRSYLSPTGESYRALNVTLDNWPNSMPTRFIGRLSGVTLSRPMLEREKLILLLALYEQIRYRLEDCTELLSIYENILHRTDRKDIAEATRKAMGYYEVEGKVKGTIKTNYLKLVAELVVDRREHMGTNRSNLTRLVEESIEEHRRAQTDFVRRTAKSGEDSLVSKPPIPLPEDERIVFLSTSHEIIEEADRMRHCVDLYTSGAVQGSYYLFHIEIGEDMATAQVARDGSVLQCRGPHNHRNKAASIGRKLLEKWGENLREISSS